MRGQRKRDIIAGIRDYYKEAKADLEIKEKKALKIVLGCNSRKQERVALYNAGFKGVEIACFQGVAPSQVYKHAKEDYEERMEAVYLGNEPPASSVDLGV